MRKIRANLNMCEKITGKLEKDQTTAKLILLIAWRITMGRWVYLFIFSLYKSHWNKSFSSCYNVTCSWMFTEFKSWGLLAAVWDVPLKGISTLPVVSPWLVLLGARVGLPCFAFCLYGGRTGDCSFFFPLIVRGLQLRRGCVGKRIQEYCMQLLLQQWVQCYTASPERMGFSF